MIFWLVLTFGSLWVFSKYRKYQKALQNVQYKPGLRFLIALSTVNITAALPPIPGYITAGNGWQWIWKYRLFSSRGDEDIVNFITFYPSIKAGYVVADPLAIKEIFTRRSQFLKFREIYQGLRLLGDNLIVAEKGVWKRHRKAVAPSFTEKTYKVTWDASMQVMSGLFEKWGKDTKYIPIKHLPDLTASITLRVISAAGFGKSTSWKDVDERPTGHKYSFQKALHIFGELMLFAIVAPRWTSSLFAPIRKVYDSADEIELYMKEMIAERRYKQGERHDLFNALLTSNEENWDNVDDKFTDEELISNMFAFLLAGHETLSHTLSFTLGLLALHEEEQDKLYKHIIDSSPKEGIPGYERMNSFASVLAVMYEALRLFPMVSILVREVEEDGTTFPVRRSDGTIEHVPVAKDNIVIIDIAALHYNPKYWPDPEKFDPSRFLGNYNKDAFVPFAGGMRVCIGRRFAEVEAVAILVLLLSNYKVELKDPDNYAGLDILEKREKLLKSRPQVTITPLDLPLAFRKRESY